MFYCMSEMVLLADKNSKAWGFSQKIQKYILEEKEEDIHLNNLEITKFRNGELGMHVKENMRQKSIYFIQDSSKNPQQWWTELLLVKDLLLSSSAKKVIFVLPNMLYSRQDRKDRSHVPISARALAESISPGLERIITMDLHAGQIQGFYSSQLPVDNLHGFPELVRHLREYHFDDLNRVAVVSPDAGAAGRTKTVLQKMDDSQKDQKVKQNYSFAMLSKIRSEAGKVEDMYLVGNVKGKNVLLPDDIIDSGGTLCMAAKVLKEKGAERLMCYGTHGIFTKGTKKLTSCFDLVMTSNTYDIPREGVEVLDMSPLFAEAIYRAQYGKSISKLFE